MWDQLRPLLARPVHKGGSKDDHRRLEKRVEHAPVSARGPAGRAVRRRRYGLRAARGRLLEQRAAQHDPPAADPCRSLEESRRSRPGSRVTSEPPPQASDPRAGAGQVEDDVRPHLIHNSCDRPRLGEVTGQPPRPGVDRARSAAHRDDLGLLVDQAKQDGSRSVRSRRSRVRGPAESPVMARAPTRRRSGWSRPAPPVRVARPLV